jgi:hypothetical protein
MDRTHPYASSVPPCSLISGGAALRAGATAAAERAAQQQATLCADIGRLREEARQSRLEAAHRDAIDAERARALRAEGELDSLRARERKHLDG